MDWTGAILILLLFVLTIMFLLKKGSSRNNSSLNLPPGPRTIPILGNLHLVDLKKPYKTMTEWSKEYGPIFRIKLGFQEMVVLTGYETVKEALVNQADAFADRAVLPIFEESLKGFGLISAHGENWKVMRRFTLSTLRDYGMGKRTIEDKITEECSVLTKTMETYAGKPFDVTRILTAAVSNIIVCILLGKRYEYEDATFLRLLKILNEIIQVSGTPGALLYNLFPKLGFLLGAHKKVTKNEKELHSFIRTTFLEYLQDLDENDQRNFIESFLVRQKQENMKMAHGGYFHNDNLIGLVDDLFGAGTDTTANTLRWAILLMMKYPDIQRKVQEEIAREIGDTQPRTDHRAKMPYTDAVIHECQRFGDILPSNLPHATTMDVTLKGFFIPKGTYIIPLLTSVLHDESQWEKPHEFYPEHFLDSEGKFVKRDAFMPFSAARAASHLRATTQCRQLSPCQQPVPPAISTPTASAASHLCANSQCHHLSPRQQPVPPAVSTPTASATSRLRANSQCRPPSPCQQPVLPAVSAPTASATSSLRTNSQCRLLSPCQQPVPPPVSAPAANATSRLHTNSQCCQPSPHQQPVPPAVSSPTASATSHLHANSQCRQPSLHQQSMSP